MQVIKYVEKVDTELCYASSSVKIWCAYTHKIGRNRPK